ncbi:helix-turn-helix domain-containing protein [Streptomyces zaomyceticus]|uniref:helix-turn-helix domain-containing protein n=1 Tax=Streptomyces zaomyceticus TaxID=68286 RepID=UPI003683CD01
MAIGAGATRSGADGTGGTGGGCAGHGSRGTTPSAELAAEMRRIKDVTELSYGQLAQRTHYSRSSWERFLNQKQLPTRIAVEQFAAASGQDPRPLLIHLERSLAHESAARAGGGPAARTGDGRGAPAGGAPATRTGGGPAATRTGGGPRGTAPAGDGPGARPVVRSLALLTAGALAGGLVTLLAREARLRHGL